MLSSVSTADAGTYSVVVSDLCGNVVTNSASVYNEACAVHLLSFLLAQARQLPLALKTRTANGTNEWHALRGSSTTLRGQTVLILGYGAIGQRLVELLRPLHMKVLAYRRKARGNEEVPLANEADHIVNILPDNLESRHFFDAARFAGLKPGRFFTISGAARPLTKTPC